MAEAPGSGIGPYRIIGPIGSGGFATVYRARDDRLDSDVALKILAENHSLTPDIRERFLGEAQLLRRIDSEQVIRVLDVGETERCQPYIVLEYAERGDLRRRVTEARATGREHTAADVAMVASALAGGLRAAHSKGLVHRDVSPGNILIKITAVATTLGADGAAPNLIAADERLVLADLGYAKDLAAHSGLTVGGGTQGFRAPEQREEASRIDQRADVYAASALLSWLVVGEDPGQVPIRDPAAHLRQRGMDAPLASALGTGLAHEPRRRQPDMDRWLSDVLGALAPPARAEGAGTATPRSEGPRRRRLRALLGLLGVGLLLGAAAAWWLARDGDGQAVTAVGGDRVRVSAEQGTVAAAIFGPERLAPGETAMFEAGATGARRFAWVTPEGDLLEGTESIEITPSSTGTLTVRLIVTGSDGTVVTVVHRVEVAE